MRNKTIVDIRPELSIQEATKPSERFQNQVLRPILKFQNPLTLEYLKSHKYFDPSCIGSGQQKKLSHLTSLLQNKSVRNQIIGIVIGLMTKEEFLEYSKKPKEYNKRIMNMQLERYMDQLS